MNDHDLFAINDIFTRVGSCNACNGKSLCCKNVKLGFNNKNISSEIEFKQLKQKDSRNKIWIKSTINSNNDWLFNCNQLSIDGACINYNKRPNLCKKYPQILDIIPIECTYSFIINIDTIKNYQTTYLEELLKKIPKFTLVQELQTYLKESIL